jgi:hypothetical protein
MNINDFSLIRLNLGHTLKPFDCGDKDLNDYFLNDSLNYYKELLSVTYVIESDKETIAFFSLLNDKISITDDEKGLWNKLSRKISNNKRKKSYPAMKIARLGVTCNIQKNGLGKNILDYLKNLFIKNNRTGCRFITVDAYKESLGFYEKNGFKFLTIKDESSDTRLMYFDLITIT